MKRRQPRVDGSKARRPVMHSLAGRLFFSDVRAASCSTGTSSSGFQQHHPLATLPSAGGRFER